MLNIVSRIYNQCLSNQSKIWTILYGCSVFPRKQEYTFHELLSVYSVNIFAPTQHKKCSSPLGFEPAKPNSEQPTQYFRQKFWCYLIFFKNSLTEAPDRHCCIAPGPLPQRLKNKGTSKKADQYLVTPTLFLDLNVSWESFTKKNQQKQVMKIKKKIVLLILRFYSLPRIRG